MRLIDADELVNNLRGNTAVDVTPALEEAINSIPTVPTASKKVMKAYFNVENWLHGDGAKKPIEIQSAMLWGALKVACFHGDISWNEMREMYGEFMSKKMDLR